MNRVRNFTVPAAVSLLFASAAAMAQVSGMNQASIWDSRMGEKDKPTPVGSPHSAARLWDDQLLDAIRVDTPKPPVHARNLFHLSAAMWDAWAVYDPFAEGFLIHEKHVAPGCLVGQGNGNGGNGNGANDVDCAKAEREEAISFAAYRLLKYRFPTGFACHPGAAINQAAFDAQMDALGYDKTNTSTVGDTPAAIGNRIAAAIIAYGQTDGAFEGNGLCYPDDTGYIPSNPDLVFKLPGNPNVIYPNHWQPLSFDYLVLQNGIVIGAATQTFVGVGWGDVKPFALSSADIPPIDPDLACTTYFGAPQPYLDPGCPPQLGGEGDATLRDALVELIKFSSWTDPADGELINASPSSMGNNSLGADDGTGYAKNPVTKKPYEDNFIPRADFVRVVAQSWSDGPKSETPPGHWNVIANEVVVDSPEFTSRKIGGVGQDVDQLEWDVKVYLALNGAVHDAAIGSWSTKNYYDSSRPITLIRHMGGNGQSSEPGGPSYHPDGLPLVPGLIEVITADTVQPGGKFEHLKSFCELGNNWGKPCSTNPDCFDEQGTGVCVSSVGKIAVLAWAGPPAANTVTAGVAWKLAGQWMPWFPKTFVTPPFPGYTSGHSTFSRAGAEVMAAVTGTPYFPGGLGIFDAEVNEYLEVEEGPSQTIELQWATYFDASDQASISRRFGGIHPFYDDYPARVMGSAIGQKAWAKALELYGPDHGKVCHKPDGPAVTITIDKAAAFAHLSHGDSLGECAPGGPIGDGDGALAEGSTAAPGSNGKSSAVSGGAAKPGTSGGSTRSAVSVQETAAPIVKRNKGR